MTDRDGPSLSPQYTTLMIPLLGALAAFGPLSYLYDGSPVPMAAVIAMVGILSWNAQRLLGYMPVIAAVPADAQTPHAAARPEKQA